MTQQILVYHFIKGLTIGEIARILSVSYSYVSNTVNDSLKGDKKEKFIILESKMNNLKE